MFEEDAEEILNKHCNCEFISECIEGIRIRCSDFEEKKKILLEGIEFAYNKAKEEVEESYRESLCNSELNLASVTERLEELNKANEWHYVKDGDLPPFDTNVLVIHRWAKTPEVGKRIKVFINSSVWVWAMCSDRFRYTSDDENVIAWKEIVLPELKESE